MRITHSILYRGGTALACVLVMVFAATGPLGIATGGPLAARSVDDEPEGNLRKLWDDACRALQSGAGESATSNEDRRAWRDRLMAAVPSRPTTVLEASILLEAAKASQAIGDIEQWKTLLVNVARSPGAGYSNRMNAAQLLIGYPMLIEDSELTIRAIEWYAEAAREREREREPDPRLRLGYSMERDPLVRGASFYRAQALLDDAMRRTPQDPARKRLAARGLVEYDACLTTFFTRTESQSQPAATRYVLHRKGLAHAILADEQGILEVVETMKAAPMVNSHDLQESVGYFLYKASEILAQASHPMETEALATTAGCEALRRFERFVEPEDPYYVEYERHLAFAAQRENRWAECLSRTERILNTSHPGVRSYLERTPLAWGDTLYLHGECLMKLGRREDARKSFRELLTRFPDDPDAAVARVRIENGW